MASDEAPDMTGIKEMRAICPDVYVGIDYSKEPHALVIRWATTTGNVELVHAEIRVEEWSTLVMVGNGKTRTRYL